MLSRSNVDCKRGTTRASPAGLGSLLDVTGIEPVTPCLQSEREDQIQVIVQAALDTTIPPERHPSCCSKDAPIF